MNLKKQESWKRFKKFKKGSEELQAPSLNYLSKGFGG